MLLFNVLTPLSTPYKSHSFLSDFFIFYAICHFILIKFQINLEISINICYIINKEFIMEMEKELNENEQSAVLLLGKGKDGEDKMVVDTIRVWAIKHGCKIIFEGPAKYDDEACAIHYCKMLDHPKYPE